MNKHEQILKEVWMSSLTRIIYNYTGVLSGTSQVVISSVGKEARMYKGIYKGHVEYKG